MKKGMFFALTLCSFNAFGQFNIERLNSITHSPDYLSGQFTQEKYLSDFEVSLESSGKFDYVKGKSVHWQTLLPIENSLVMTPKSIVSKQGQTELVNIQADTNPTVTLLNEVFFSILTAQWQTLEQYFDITGSIDGNSWQVNLLPKDPLMAQIITKVELKGDQFLRHLTFYENNGDFTAISFQQLSLQH